MKANKVQEEQLKKWFGNEFWAFYGGNFITTRQKGGRGEALKIIYRINPDIEMQIKMLANMKAQLRADDKDKRSGLFVANWPMCTTYLNKNRHEDEIESHSFESSATELSKCPFKGCEEDVIGSRYKTCQTHYMFEEAKESIRLQLKNIGMSPTPGESPHDYSMRCKERYLKSPLKGLSA